MIKQETVTLKISEAGGILAERLGLDPKKATIEITPGGDGQTAMIRLTVTTDMDMSEETA